MMTTRYAVICGCGHKGNIKLRENDTIYGKGNWEKYSLEGLNGKGSSMPENASWDIIFQRMNISCPKCNAQLTHSNMEK